MFFQVQNNIHFVRKIWYDYKPTFIGSGYDYILTLISVFSAETESANRGRFIISTEALLKTTS